MASIPNTRMDNRKGGTTWKRADRCGGDSLASTEAKDPVITVHLIIQDLGIVAVVPINVIKTDHSKAHSHCPSPDHGNISLRIRSGHLLSVGLSVLHTSHPMPLWCTNSIRCGPTLNIPMAKYEFEKDPPQHLS